MGCRNALFFFLLIFSGCSLSNDDPAVSVFTASFDFNDSQEGWQPDFAEMPASREDSIFYQLQFAYTELPEDLGEGKSLMLSGNNHSDDLFMFMKRKISGLIPNTTYTLVFEVELASNALKGSVGAGGSPGESVFLKAGASKVEPVKMVHNEKWVLNIDKGDQSMPGLDAAVLGDIAIPSTASDYTIISRSNAASSSAPLFMAQTNSKGEIWLFVGTDSGFEGTTTVYYTKVNIVFSTTY